MKLRNNKILTKKKVSLPSEKKRRNFIFIFAFLKVLSAQGSLIMNLVNQMAMH